MPPFILIRCNSHRARDRACGHLPPMNGYYDNAGGRGLYLVTPEEWEKIKAIKGVRKTRPNGPLGLCWSAFHTPENTAKENEGRRRLNLAFPRD